MPKPCMYLPLCAALCACLLLLLAACGSTQAYQASYRLTYGLTTEPAGFDPHLHEAEQLEIVLRQVYDTLIYRDPATSDFVPGLATDWTVASDGLTYTFSLRPDVLFHDGFAFNADAVAANLERISSITAARAQQGLVRPHARALLGPYAGYRVLDAFTIQILLSEPYPPLLDALSQVYLGISSPVALNNYSFNRYQYHQVGTGPYQFVEYVPGNRIVLRRNPAYAWGPAFYAPPQAATPDEIVFRFFQDANSRVRMLENEAAQVVAGVPPADARSLTGNSQVQLVPRSVPGQPVQFLINVNRYPTDNRVVRQALIHATNRTAIVGVVYQGLTPVAWGPLTPGTLFYTGDVVGRYDYNLQQARALLESVGFTDQDGNGFLNAGEEDLELVMIVPSWERTPEIALLMQEQWRDVGIRLSLRQVPNLTTLREIVASGEYHLVAYDVRGYDPVFLNDFFISDAVNNFSNYSNPELNNALRQATREATPSIRRELYRRIQLFIMDEALILPISDVVSLSASNLSVQGLQFDRYGWAPLLTNMQLADN